MSSEAEKARKRIRRQFEVIDYGKLVDEPYWHWEMKLFGWEKGEADLGENCVEEIYDVKRALVANVTELTFNPYCSWVYSVYPINHCSIRVSSFEQGQYEVEQILAHHGFKMIGAKWIAMR
jgi:hypothetical protein